MISHQDVVVELEGVSFLVSGEDLQILLVVLLFSKDVLSVIPPRQEVVHLSLGGNPGTPWHGEDLS